MKQFLLPPEFPGVDPGESGTGERRPVQITLRGRDFRYLCRVLRLGEGARLPGVDVAGVEYELSILRVENDHCIVSASLIAQRARLYSPDRPQIVLVQCIPKAHKIDLVVRQATEAGVSEIHIANSEFSVADHSAVPRASNGSGVSARLDRLRRIAREAFQQSGNAELPEILPPEPLAIVAHALRPDSETVAIFFHQVPLAHASLHGYLSTGPKRIVIVIGPEGGLSGRETDLLQSEGFLPAYLGPTVLRTETAALYAVAAVRTIVLERKTWQIE